MLGSGRYSDVPLDRTMDFQEEAVRAPRGPLLSPVAAASPAAAPGPSPSERSSSSPRSAPPPVQPETALPPMPPPPRPSPPPGGAAHSPPAGGAGCGAQVQTAQRQYELLNSVFHGSSWRQPAAWQCGLCGLRSERKHTWLEHAKQTVEACPRCAGGAFRPWKRVPGLQQSGPDWTNEDRCGHPDCSRLLENISGMQTVYSRATKLMYPADAPSARHHCRLCGVSFCDAHFGVGRVLAPDYAWCLVGACNRCADRHYEEAPRLEVRHPESAENESTAFTLALHAWVYFKFGGKVTVGEFIDPAQSFLQVALRGKQLHSQQGQHAMTCEVTTDLAWTEDVVRKIAEVHGVRPVEPQLPTGKRKEASALVVEFRVAGRAQAATAGLLCDIIRWCFDNVDARVDDRPLVRCGACSQPRTSHAAVERGGAPVERLCGACGTGIAARRWYQDWVEHKDAVHSHFEAYTFCPPDAASSGVSYLKCSTPCTPERLDMLFGELRRRSARCARGPSPAAAAADGEWLAPTPPLPPGRPPDERPPGTPQRPPLSTPPPPQPPGEDAAAPPLYPLPPELPGRPLEERAPGTPPRMDPGAEAAPAGPAAAEAVTGGGPSPARSRWERPGAGADFSLPEVIDPSMMESCIESEADPRGQRPLPLPQQQPQQQVQLTLRLAELEARLKEVGAENARLRQQVCAPAAPAAGDPSHRPPGRAAPAQPPPVVARQAAAAVRALRVPQGAVGGEEAIIRVLRAGSGVTASQVSMGYVDSLRQQADAGSPGLATVGGRKVRIRTFTRQSFWKENMLEEAEVLAKLCHQNVVRLLAYALNDKHFAMVHAAPGRGYAANLIGSEDYTPVRRLRTLAGAARGLQYVHRERVVHGRVSLQAIALSWSWDGILADCGVMPPDLDRPPRQSDDVRNLCLAAKQLCPAEAGGDWVADLTGACEQAELQGPEDALIALVDRFDSLSRVCCMCGGIGQGTTCGIEQATTCAGPKHFHCVQCAADLVHDYIDSGVLQQPQHPQQPEHKGAHCRLCDDGKTLVRTSKHLLGEELWEEYSKSCSP